MSRLMLSPMLENILLNSRRQQLGEEDERSEMIRGQLANRFGGQQAAAGGIGMLGQMMPAQQPAAMPPPPQAAEPFVGPTLEPLNSRVTNMRGEVLSEMQYPNLGGGNYGEGQTTFRRGGYNLGSGMYENAIAGGQEIPRGPLGLGDMYRDAYERNLADRRFSPFGYGMPPAMAASLADRQMAPAIADAELMRRFADAEASRQNARDIAQMQIDAGRFDRNSAMSGRVIEGGINAAAQGLLPQYLRGIEQMRQMGLPVPGSAPRAGGAPGQVGAATAGGVAGVSGPPPLSDDDKIQQLIRTSVDRLPSTFEYAAVGSGSGPNAMVRVRGAAEGFGPENQRHILDRLRAANLSPEGLTSFSDALMRTPGGKQIRDALISRTLSDMLAARQGQMARDEGWYDEYPAELNFPELPGYKAVSNLSGGNMLTRALGRLGGAYTQRGIPNYKVTLPTGEVVTTDVANSLSNFGDILGAQGGMDARTNANDPFNMTLLRQLGALR